MLQPVLDILAEMIAVDTSIPVGSKASSDAGVSAVSADDNPGVSGIE